MSDDLQESRTDEPAESGLPEILPIDETIQRLRCSKCRKRLKVPQSVLEKKLRCPRCGTPVALSGMSAMQSSKTRRPRISIDDSDSNVEDAGHSDDIAISPNDTPVAPSLPSETISRSFVDDEQDMSAARVWDWREFFKGSLYSTVLLSVIGVTIALGVIAISSQQSVKIKQEHVHTLAKERENARIKNEADAKARTIAADKARADAAKAKADELKARAEALAKQRADEKERLEAIAKQRAEEKAKAKIAEEKAAAKAREESRRHEKIRREQYLKLTENLLAAYGILQAACVEHDQAWERAGNAKRDVTDAVQRSIKLNAKNIEKAERLHNECLSTMRELNKQYEAPQLHFYLTRIYTQCAELLTEARSPSVRLDDFREKRREIHEAVTKAHRELALLLP